MDVLVSYPAAWCLVPLVNSELVTDPDLEDDPPRYSRPLKGGWGQIGATVVAAVAAAQLSLTDVMVDQAAADVDLPRGGEPRLIAETWLSAPPEFSPMYGQIYDGRHRTWGVRSAGLEVAPVVTCAAADAIRAWHADPRDDWLPDAETLDSWEEQLRWWSHSPAAGSWRRVNAVHITLFQGVIARWRTRLSLA